MIRDIGFFIPHLPNSQETNIQLEEIRKLIDDHPFNQICLFNSTTDRVDHLNIPVLPTSHAKYFSGDLFMFDTMSLLIANPFPNIVNKYFYATDIPWVNGYSEYELWKLLFGQENLKIIANNQQLYDIYNICWDNAIGIMESFSYQELKNVI